MGFGDMTLRIAALAEEHFEPLHRVRDAVAREKRYLAMTQAPPRDEAFAFFGNNIAKGAPHFVALWDDDVVGWCDVLPVFGEARRHIGVLGIGLVPRARHKGLGTSLMTAAIAAAWQQGFTRIELTVRTDNDNAVKLYERLGFRQEGLLGKAFLVDDQYFDCYLMALLRDDIA
jgi:RimJ/RimL family protein N-acetyltransferase